MQSNTSLVRELTPEQTDIINCDIKAGEVMKILAFAGTGKTSTLIEYTKRRPHTKFLYVAFNKSVQLEASSKFSINVKCRTAHSLAWEKFGSKYRDNLVQSLKTYYIKKVMNLNSYEEAKFTGETLSNFLISSDADISNKHLSITALRYYNYKKVRMPDIFKNAKILWDLMLDPENLDIGMIHDGYLKLFQLSKPMLDYDCILLDEAQDINPVICSIIMSQKSAKIIVGDEHQQIYSFRGAQNIIGEIKADHVRYLTRSFRFNKGIAKIANYILYIFKGEKKELISLKDKAESINDSPYTFISRTNAVIFDKAAQLYKNKKIGFVGGIQGYRFSMIENVFYLYSGNIEKINAPFVKLFKSYEYLKEYACQAYDLELVSICKIVEKYRQTIPKLISDIYENAVPTENAEVILSTAHKSKGLEWDTIMIGNDFPIDIDKDTGIIDIERVDTDEFNLLYVVITRAKNKVKVNKGCFLHSLAQKVINGQEIILKNGKNNKKKIKFNRSLSRLKDIKNQLNEKEKPEFPEKNQNNKFSETSKVHCGLDSNQKSFIERKLFQLGNLSAANEFYMGSDAVSIYARELAKVLFANMNKKSDKSENFLKTSIVNTTAKEDKNIENIKEIISNLPIKNQAKNQEQIKIKRTYPRAWEPWLDIEDELLISLAKEIKNIETLSNIFLRKPNAISKRLMLRRVK